MLVVHVCGVVSETGFGGRDTHSRGGKDSKVSSLSAIMMMEHLQGMCVRMCVRMCVYVCAVHMTY